MSIITCVIFFCHLVHHTAHLDNKKHKHKKSPLTRVTSDPNHLPPVNLSRDDDTFTSNPSVQNHNNHSNNQPGRGSSDAEHGPRSNSSYNRAASRYKNATKVKSKVRERNRESSAQAVPPKSPARPTKVQLPHISNNHSRLSKPPSPTKGKQKRGVNNSNSGSIRGGVRGRERAADARYRGTKYNSDSDSDSDDGKIFHRHAHAHTPPPPTLNRYDDDFEAPTRTAKSALPEKGKGVPPPLTETQMPAGSSHSAAAMSLSLNLESVKDKLARMEQQLVIRRQVCMCVQRLFLEG